MIDFPQMVSVSHRNAKMYECSPFPDYLSPQVVHSNIRWIYVDVILISLFSGTLTVILNASSSFSERGKLLISNQMPEL